MTCAICGIRKPKRYCPGVRGEICTICCGTEREQTITCPVECGYLREAHDHEKKRVFDPSILPNKDIEVSDAFLQDNQLLIAVLGKAVAMGALRAAEATDYDIREGLEALIRSYRALQSGLYYDAHPTNPYAAGIQDSFQACVADLRKAAKEEGGNSTLRDSTLLNVLVFLQRFEYAENNGRKRSRAFLDLLTRLAKSVEEELVEAVKQEERRIIL